MLGLAYPHLFITLFGPRNETFIGELNMTAITLPRTDTRAASSADDVGASASSSSSSSSSSSRSSYDSRGAAYYICVVILVYALAIALFIVSLARRRRNANDIKYRLAHDQNVDYQQAEERQEGCWKERCRDSSEPPRMPSSPWSSSSSSSTSSNSEVAQQRPVNLDVDPKNATATGSAQLNLDEVITLVQFLPCSISSSSSKGSAASDADRGASCCGDERVSISGQELETEQEKKRYRWSMGPDGNIWILQVEDADVIDNTENNNDNTPSNNAFNCHLKLTTHPLGPSHSFKDPPCVQSCCSSDATANVPLLSLGVKTVPKAKVEQQRPKTLPFSPVPKGYRHRGRTFNKERKARLLSSDNQDSKTTYQERNYHCPTIGDQTTNSSSLIARKHRWEENHYREQQLGSPHFIQKLIHVTSV